MSDTHHTNLDTDRLNATETTSLGARATSVFGLAAVIGALGLVAAIVLGFVAGDGFRRFYFAYLTAYAFFVSIALGALAFVLLQHVARAGWSVSVRRIAELLGAMLPVLAVLSLPILVSVVTGTEGHAHLYRWAQPVGERAAGSGQQAVGHGEEWAAGSGQRAVIHGEERAVGHGENDAHVEAASGHESLGNPHADEMDSDPHAPTMHAFDGHLDGLTLEKRNWLNPPFFVIRVLTFLVVLSGVALFYWRTSVAQDANGDVSLTLRMQKAAGPMILLCGITLTLLSFDLLMSLDPHWFSTMFGVYYLAGCLIGGWAGIIIIVNLLQMAGFLKTSITTEHLHDLGKYLFGFVFFWGYIAFSQYMLLWYANLPETTGWLLRRGLSTIPGQQNAFTWVAIAVLFGHFLIPFAGLMSRHVKRTRPGLLFWAVWLMVFHYLDLIWIVKPELSFINGIGPIHDYVLNVGLIDLCCVLGIGGVFVAAWVKMAGAGALRPLHDPRLHESVVFENL